MRSIKKIFFPKEGLTLVELLIVTVILAMVSLAVYSTLNSGIRIWRKVSQHIPEEELAVFFDKFTRDLRNTIVSESMSFQGAAHRLEFPSLVSSQKLEITTIGRVVYNYDQNGEKLVCLQEDVSDIYNHHEGTEKYALKGVVSCRFSYYNYDKQVKKYFWAEENLPNTFPMAVRMELEFADGAKQVSFTRTVTIPAAS